MWETVKNYRLKYTHNTNAVVPVDIDGYLDQQAAGLNMTNVPHDLPIVKTEINYSFLLVGFKLFYYLNRYQDRKDFTFTVKSYIDLFNHNSFGTILKAVINKRYLNIQNIIEAERKIHKFCIISPEDKMEYM